MTFKPAEGETFQGEAQITDTTGGGREIISRIALTGSTMPAEFSQNLPTITAPIRPSRLPDRASRVGDLNGDGLLDAVDIGQLSAIVAGRAPAPQSGSVGFGVADVNGDGTINSADLSLLGNALAGNVSGLPRLRPSASEVARHHRHANHSTQAASTKHDAPARRSSGVSVMARPR